VPDGSIDFFRFADYKPDKGDPKVSEKSAVRFIKSGTLPPSPGYSQAVEFRPGARIIYIAGQVAMDVPRKLIGEGDLRAQATQTFENLKAALQASVPALKRGEAQQLFCGHVTASRFPRGTR